MKSTLIIIFISLTFIFTSILVSAELGVGNVGDVGIDLIPTAPSFNNNTGAVNSTDYWSGMNTINATQMENNGGVLNILESWLETFFNTLFGGKTTDDLTEGVTNLYYDETTAENELSDVFVNITGDTMTGDLNMSNRSIYYVDTLFVHNITGGSQVYISSPIITDNITATNFVGSGKYLTDVNATGGSGIWRNETGTARFDGNISIDATINSTQTESYIEFTGNETRFWI